MPVDHGDADDDAAGDDDADAEFSADADSDDAGNDDEGVDPASDGRLPGPRGCHRLRLRALPAADDDRVHLHGCGRVDARLDEESQLHRARLQLDLQSSALSFIFSEDAKDFLPDPRRSSAFSRFHR